jgi:hypothetical protein
MARPIVIEVLAKTDQARRNVTDIGNDVESSGKKFAGAAKNAAKFAAIGLGAALVGAAVGAAKLAQGAIEDEQAAARMAQTFTKAAGATRQQIAATESWISAQGRSKGVADDELRPALSRLVTATGDVGKAQKLTSLAMDVSAGTGKSLEQVSTALMKAQNGQVSSLSRLGINTKNAAGDTITMEQATKRMADTFGGAAATNADTLGGRIDRLKLMASEAGESLGAKMLPPLNAFVGLVLDRGVPAVAAIATAIQTWASGMAAKLAPTITQVQGVVGTWGQTLTGTIIPAVQRVAGYLVSTFAPVLTQIGGVITGKVIPAVVSIAQFLYGRLVPAVVAVATDVGAKLKPILDQVAATISTKVIPTVVKIIERFREWQPTIEKVVLVVVKIIGKVLEFAAAVLGKVLPPVISFAATLVSKLVPAVLDGIEIVARIIGKVIEFGQKIVAGVQKVGEFVTGLKNKFAEATTYVNGIPEKLVTALGSLGTKLLNAGQELIQGLIDGISSKLADIRAKMSEVADTVKGFLPGSPVKEGPLTSWNNGGAGKRLMDQLVSGIDARKTAVSSAMSRVSTSIGRSLDGRTVGTRFASDVATAFGSPVVTAGAAFAASVTSSRDNAQTFRVVLSAEQLNEIERGRRATLDIRAYQQAGGVL